ncbi:hypothetical protein [Haloplanus natans]|uniref:hypothetical protein n=1 Tax=Haloplanus natans TaxID=376171 RepID=UPI000677C613|nr:hypothetical protein [Haloplanus natans]
MSRPLTPSDPPRIVRTVVVFALALLLIAAGSVLQPDGGTDRRYVYEAHVVDGVDPGELPDGVVGNVRDCNYVAVESGACAVVREIRTDGAIRIETDADVGPEFFEYEYVSASGRTFRPVVRTDGATLVLDLERVDPKRARRVLAAGYGDVSDAARTAVADGQVRTVEPIPRDERYVVRNGTYYAIERDRTVEASERPAWPLRLAGWLGGLALVWYAGRRGW